MTDKEPTEQDLEGLANGTIEEDFPTPILSPCEEKINENVYHNASIIIGRDRPAGLTSGYGSFSKKQNGDKSTTIDITVGRYSKNKDNLKKSDVVGNNFQLDASRIYISQKTDIDDNFQITEAGTIEPAKGKAAIGIKSDNIRIIGRETIKLVAQCGEPNSLSLKEQSVTKKVVGIELITGITVDKKDVQGIVKSDNLKSFLNELISLFNTTLGAFHTYVQFQNNFNTYVAMHEHDGHFRSDIAGAVKILQPFDLLKAYTKYNSDITSATNKDIGSIREALAAISNNYLNETNAKQFIGSIYNKTN